MIYVNLYLFNLYLVLYMWIHMCEAIYVNLYMLIYICSLIYVHWYMLVCICESIQVNWYVNLYMLVYIQYVNMYIYIYIVNKWILVLDVVINCDTCYAGNAGHWWYMASAARTLFLAHGLEPVRRPDIQLSMYITSVLVFSSLWHPPCPWYSSNHGHERGNFELDWFCYLNYAYVHKTSHSAPPSPHTRRE